MGLLGDLAGFFLGRHPEDDERPTSEDQQAAQAADQLMSSEYADAWQDGIDMGTIPTTPTEYEGEDTDPQQPTVKRNRFLPWNW